MWALRIFCSALLLAAALRFEQPAAAGNANAAASAFVQELGNGAIEELTDPAIPRSEREARFRRPLNDASKSP